MEKSKINKYVMYIAELKDGNRILIDRNRNLDEKHFRIDLCHDRENYEWAEEQQKIIKFILYLRETFVDFEKKHWKDFMWEAFIQKPEKYDLGVDNNDFASRHPFQYRSSTDIRILSEAIHIAELVKPSEANPEQVCKIKNQLNGFIQHIITKHRKDDGTLIPIAYFQPNYNSVGGIEKIHSLLLLVQNKSHQQIRDYFNEFLKREGKSLWRFKLGTDGCYDGFEKDDSE